MSALVPNGHIAVRMFCLGLGDCFLVAIRNGDVIDYTAIDCGVISGNPQGPARGAEAVRLLRESCGGKLDRLLLTHQHWDHVSSFYDAPQEWEAFEVIRELWFAWTENPRDALAQKLAGQRSKAADTVEQALVRCAPDRQARLTALLGFAGYDSALAAKGGPRVGRTKAAMDKAREIVAAKGGRVVYRNPGEVVNLPSGVQFVTLGPPKDEKQIKRSDPSRANPEVYTLAGIHAMSQGFEAALDPNPTSATLPFDVENAIPLDTLDQVDLKWWPEMEEVRKKYLLKANEWRRIDGDWLGVAEMLALNLDSDTNNTSLAFALYDPSQDWAWLFAADAQVGNWLSWGNQSYPISKSDGKKGTMTVEDLLGRTVFYKVGHHGSHNATMRARGLELMTHPDLCAMIPVDVNVAHDIKGWKQMPFLPMTKRLGECTEGRVVQLDSPQAPAPFVHGPANEVFGRPAFVDFNP